MKILKYAIEGNMTEQKIRELILDNAFEESMLTIFPAIKNQDWQLLDSNFETPILQNPVMPITLLEKRWLKTILLDKRVGLFLQDNLQERLAELQNIEPLFHEEDIVYFDRYLDGDPYEDSAYRLNFGIARQAISEEKMLRIQYFNGRNNEGECIIQPIKLEYSDKEDKFRILCTGKNGIRTLNMGRVIKCSMLGEKDFSKAVLPERRKETLMLELTDERSTLERAMMKFSHYKKEVEKIEDSKYHVFIEYDVEDETDVLIQVMAFGRYMKILGPERIKIDMKRRISKQLSMINL